MNGQHRLGIAFGAAVAAAAFTSQVHAAAFGLAEQSVSGMGNALAGSAAVGEDASTIFFNPAGMSRLGSQVVGGFHYVSPSIKFSDNGNSSAGLLQSKGGDAGDAGTPAVLPNLYGIYQASPTLRLGLGINAPFGLVTDYNPGWVGRFQATKSEVSSLNFNPSVAWQATSTLSLGAGINYQIFQASLANQVNYTAAIAQVSLAAAAANPGREGTARVSGYGDGWGWNVGGLWQFTPSMRAGLAYRSPIKQQLTGDVNFTGPSQAAVGAGATIVAGASAPGGALSNGNIRATITTPETASLSWVWDVNNRWTVLADASRFGWSRIQNLTFYRQNGTVLSSIEEHWKDTWRFSAGVTHNYSDKIRLRTGVAYDQTPVKDDYRTARLPDQDRIWLSFGFGYQYSRALGFDLAYTHIFVRDGTINQNQGNTNAYGSIQGTYKNSIDILSAQAVYKF